MIVVGGGTSSRFGADKLLALVEGIPLIAHTVRAVRPFVDKCVLVCRGDQLDELQSLDLGVDMVAGGASRTGSEIAGLTALADEYHLIGIHDAARPAIRRELIDQLFAQAAHHGGAIPVVAPAGLLIDRATSKPLLNAAAAQTPQVFRAADLRSAFSRAAREGFDGHDTAEVVRQFANTTTKAVAGDPGNIKVTYPGDLDRLEKRLRARARSEPR